MIKETVEWVGGGMGMSQESRGHTISFFDLEYQREEAMTYNFQPFTRGKLLLKEDHLLVETESHIIDIDLKKNKMNKIQNYHILFII
mgnify:CR=1 FL=1